MTGTRATARFGAAVAVSMVALVGSIVVAVAIGPSALRPSEVWAVIAERLHLPGATDVAPIREAIVWQLRLPRVLLDAVVGAGLAVVGTVMQAVTRNALADPYLLGISSGASLGAVSVLVLGVGAGAVGLAGGAFAGALLAFAAVVALAISGGRLAPATTVLAGVAVASICSAVTSLIIVAAANAEQTRGVLHWLLGSLAGTRWRDVAVAAPALVLALGACLTRGRSLNALAFGDDDAATLGVDTHRLRWVLLVSGSLLTGVLVSVSGAIGFVGLLLPHAARMLVGRDHRRLLPIAALAGAIFLIWADTAARTMLNPQEVPVGVVTALLGAPAFALLVRRRGHAA